MKRMLMFWALAGTVLGVGGCSSTDLAVKDRPQIEIKADGVVCADVKLASIVPIPGQKPSQRINMEIRNNGKADLVIQKVEFLETNADGTPRNQWVTFDWGTTKPADLPLMAIHPNDFASVIRFDIVYQPQTIDTNGITMQVTSNDPNTPVKTCSFTPPKCLPKVHIDPPEYTFINATSSHPETQIFQIQNLGNCALSVSDIQFSQPESKFTIKRDFPNGSEVLPASDAGYKPLTFTVTYQPQGECGADAAAAQVFSSDPAQNPITVPLKTSCENGTIAVSYEGQANGCLDFTDVGPGKEKTLPVNIYNEGPAIFSVVKGNTSIPEDPDKTHYTFEGSKPGPTPTPIDLDTQDFALGQGVSMDINVTYKGSLLGLNGSLVIKYKQATMKTLTVPLCGGKPKPCIDLGPGDVKQGNNLLQFHSSKDQAISRPFVVYNCGNADLVVKSYVLTDDFYPEDPSKYWTLDDPPAGDLTIVPGGLRNYSVTMKVTDNEQKVGGKLDVHYIDPTGAESILAGGIDLAGIIDPAATAPIADPGKPEDYTGVKVGEPLLLDGSHSQPGSGGLYQDGYQWWLTAKPAGSLLIVNGPPGGAFREVIPDKAGSYTFMLQVYGTDDDFLYSDVASITIVVGE